MFCNSSITPNRKTRYDINLVAIATYRVASAAYRVIYDISKISAEIYIDALHWQRLSPRNKLIASELEESLNKEIITIYDWDMDSFAVFAVIALCAHLKYGVFFL